MTQHFMTLDAAEAAVQKINHRRVATRIDQLTINPFHNTEGEIQIDVKNEEGRTMHCAPFAERSILKAVGVGRRLLDGAKDDIDLLERALDKGKRMAREDGMVVLTVTGNDEIQCVTPGDGLPLSLPEVWNVVKHEKGLQGVVDIPDLSRGRYDLRLVTDRESSPRRNVGDITMAGVRVSIDSTIKLNPFIYRLACANGMQRVEDGDVLEIDMGDPIASLRASYAHVADLSVQFGMDFASSDDVRIPNPTDWALRALRIARAPAKIRAAIAERIPREAPNGTLYEVLNVVTAIARERSDKPRVRNRLESVAGRVLAMQAGTMSCPSCGSHS